VSLVRFRFWARRCSSMVEHQPSKLNTWVRFPSPALKMNILFIMREWLSWWSTTLPRSGSRVRVPSRALLIYKRYPKRIPFVYKRVLPDSNGSYLRSTSVGAGLCFFSFIRDEGVAGAFFSVTSQHTGHWPGLF
jgi:hypothetical protein